MQRFCFLVGLMIVLFAFGCKKVKGPKDVKSAETNNDFDTLVTMKAIINGKAWKADTTYSYYIKSSANDSEVENLMVVATQKKNNPVTTITFNINAFEGIREYLVKPPFYSITYFEGNIRHAATSGVINVLSDSNNAYSGTYYFVADSIVATNGTFRVPIQ